MTSENSSRIRTIASLRNRPFSQARRLLLAAVLVAASTSAARAYPGDLDESFGAGGKVLTSFGAGQDIARAIALQSDGRIVVAGRSDLSLALARYHADGSLDASFGNGGKVTTDFGVGHAEANAVLVQPDGRIVVAGRSDSATAIARYDAAGNPDPTFGSAGRVRIPANGPVLAIAIQADGRLVTAGGQNSTVVARYNEDGSPDASFGTNGVVYGTFGDDFWTFTSVAVQADGRIVTSGGLRQPVAPGGPYVEKLVVARFEPDGDLDPTFSEDGKYVSDAEDDDYGRAVALQGDGKLLAAGNLRRHNADGGLLMRFTEAGTPDASFGQDGRVVAHSNNSLRVFHVVTEQDDGRVLVAGSLSDPWWYGNEFVLMRFTAGGTADAGFGGGNGVRTQVGAGNAIAYAMAVQPDGNVILAGEASNGSNSDFVLVRYDMNPCADGVLDPGEQCDDGNHVDGDCCSSTCEFEAAGSSCPSDGNVCTDDVCTAFGTCGVANTAPCDNGNYCDGADVCLAGTCSHTGNPCTTECNMLCDEDTDSCGHDDGTACDDGAYCNGADTCSGGSCSVHAGNPCTSTCNTVCDESGNSCDANANGMACDDGVFCNGADTCQGGTCAHAGDPCTSQCADGCDEDAGACTWTMAGTPCDDGDACTVDDACSDGVCAGAAKDCDDGNLCTVDSCSEIDGECTNEAVPVDPSQCLLAGRSTFKLRDKGADGGKLSWKWGRGEAFAGRDIGDPIMRTSYGLCIFDFREDGGISMSESMLPIGSFNWDTIPGGWSYEDKEGRIAGFTKVRIKYGAAGKTSMQIAMSGEDLLLPGPAGEQYFESDPGVVVQLVNTEGACWTSEFVPEDVVRNSSTSFTAKPSE